MTSCVCIICTEKYPFDSFSNQYQKHSYAIQGCGHVFHFQCIKNWMKNSKSCPICRGYANESRIYRIHLNFESDDNSTLNEDQMKLATCRSYIEEKKLELKKLLKEESELEAKIKRQQLAMDEKKELKRHPRARKAINNSTKLHSAPSSESVGHGFSGLCRLTEPSWYHLYGYHY